MLRSVSQAGFASERWNALKTNFQDASSRLESTFSKHRWKGSYICAAATQFSGKTPESLFKDPINHA